MVCIWTVCHLKGYTLANENDLGIFILDYSVFMTLNPAYYLPYILELESKGDVSKYINSEESWFTYQKFLEFLPLA